MDLEAERKEREQRNHEILMKILERGAASNGGGFADMIDSFVKLQALAGTKSLTDQVRELKAVHDLFGDREEKEPSFYGHC